METEGIWKRLRMKALQNVNEISCQYLSFISSSLSSMDVFMMILVTYTLLVIVIINVW